ncbi:related to L-sorbosone dehydrogenase [Ramularia collo-cygni]|uniref:Related to L-sorbosone dehydrogenase n=1 Tax=Ramularia collo-cygni TaxID=112498 RepID=A0A2D3V5Y9_9PEZI|nr:related to L-sorbosone dehydrogenase [Ramularia collo-cygni]CZT15713.1 related to L-sorbosone dehydrogenase [Ramularia collo-cygni]
MKYTAASLTTIGLYATFTAAQQCTATISASGYPAPSLANGWSAHIIANGFTKPRSLKLDNEGNMLVVDQDEENGGVYRVSFTGQAPCLVESNRFQVWKNGSLNHGIELSPDGSTLYASSQDAVYAWPYEASSGAIGYEKRVIELGGSGTHATRTLLLPPNDPDFLLVSWGSNGNVDPQARDPTSGYSSIKAFNISDTSRVWNYTTDGLLVGYGLRNSIGLAQNPITGGIFSNENSVDNLFRDGVEIVEDNPAEELNFHGYLNGTDSPNFGAYYGYPDCFSAWDAEAVPDYDDLQTGQQFAANFNESVDDAWCRENAVSPVLSFTAHMAPMDQEFNTAGTVMYISFRGSWNRENPAGYKLAAIPFNPATGMPTADPNSRDGYLEIMANEDESKCPDECFRPVGLEWSAGGEQLFMASDATGEIYIVYRDDGMPVDDFTVPGSETEDGNDEQIEPASPTPSETEEGDDEQSGPASPTPSDESSAVTFANGQWWVAAAAAVTIAFFS